MNNQKTIREWFMELPESYRTQAIKNTEKQYPRRLNLKEAGLYESLFIAFDWNKTSKGQGYEYWRRLAESIKVEVELNHPTHTLSVIDRLNATIEEQRREIERLNDMINNLKTKP